MSAEEWQKIEKRKKRRPKKAKLRQFTNYEPIMSYGIVLFSLEKRPRKQYPTPKYLLIQRRDSIEYVDFLQGNYVSRQLPFLFNRMTTEEKQRILNHNFDELWDDLWINKNYELYRRGHGSSKRKFESNRSSFSVMIGNSKTTNEEMKWGFPKGRKQERESEYMCALREFQEETRFNSKDVRRFCDQPFTEVFQGSNKKIYGTRYFVCYTGSCSAIKKEDHVSPLRSVNGTISEEVLDMKWVNVEEAKKLLNERRSGMIQVIENYIQSLMRKKPMTPKREFIEVPSTL